MKINRKIFLVLLVFHAFFGVIAITALFMMILPKFTALERERARHEIEGCAEALDREVIALDNILGTWRQWDSMLQFAKDRSQAFIDGNLTSSDLTSMDADLLVILDANHEVILALDSGADDAAKRTLGVAKLDIIGLTRKLWDAPSPEKEVSGFIGTDGRPLIVAAGMITDSTATADPAGVIIIARFLTEEVITRIGKGINIPLTAVFSPYDPQAETHPKVQEARIQEINARELRASISIAGMRGKRIVELSAVLPRTIRANAMNTLVSAAAIILGGGLISTFLFFAALEVTVLSRLFRMNREVHMIGSSNRESVRITSEGSDEISQTADAVNLLIGRLNASFALAQKNAEQFRMVTELAPVGIYLTDAAGACIFVNTHYSEITGIAAGAALGKGWQDILHPEDRKNLLVQSAAAMEQRGQMTLECRVVRPDGEVLWVKANANPLFDDTGVFTGYLGTLADITNTKERELRLEHKSLYDDLTGVANRILFHDRLGQAFEEARRRPPHRFAIVFADLDGFKAVNDTHGHDAGDAVLKEVARRMSKMTRPGDTVCRLGGDEFALILRDASEIRHAHTVADRILAGIQEPIHYKDASMEVGMSMGIAIDYETYEKADDLLAAADKAMYRAKLAGKGTVFFATPPTRVPNNPKN